MSDSLQDGDNLIGITYLGAKLTLVKSRKAFGCFRCKDVFPSGAMSWKPLVASDRMQRYSRLCRACGELIGRAGA
jgi:hypothetical protein